MKNIAIFDCGIINEQEKDMANKMKEVAENFGSKASIIKILEGERIENLDDYTHYMISGSGYDYDTREEGIIYLRDVLKKLHSLKNPTFAICFGAQIISSVFGGKVRKKEKKETDFVNVEIVDNSDLFKDIPNPLKVFQYHSDFISELPEGSRRLAKNDICNQAYNYHNFWCVQFHPEADEELIYDELKKIKEKTGKDISVPPDYDYMFPRKLFYNFLNKC